MQIDSGAFEDLSANDYAGISDKTTWNFTTATHTLYHWHNYVRPADVNNDEVITPLDALITINHLNTSGASLLPEDKPTGSPWYDFNKDGWVSPADAIGTINYINDSTYDVSVGVIPVDEAGNRIDLVSVGDVFYLTLVTEDLRAVPNGVFAVFADVYYASSSLTLVGVPSYESPYINFKTSDLSETGLINEWGAIAGIEETKGGAYVVSRIPVKANKAGSTVFGASAADVSGHDVLVYGKNDAIPPSAIEFLASELLITDAAEGEFWGGDPLVDADLVARLVQYQNTDIDSLDQFFGQY